MFKAAEIRSALAAAAAPRLIQTASELESSAREWRDCPILGIDTEFVRERTYRAELGLLQISDGMTAWLIDPLPIGRHDAVCGLFQDPSILKVIHSASEDLEVLWQTFEVTPAPMMDTQIACALLGQPLQQSYHNTVKWLCGIAVDKEQTRSNWLKRPLSAQQLHYAATDVVFLPLLLRTLREKLVELQRWDWAQEDVDLMCAQSRQPPEPDEAYRRIPGAGRLRPAELRVLHALARWREETAIARNRARGFVVSDQVLLRIAASRPKTAEALATIEGLHPRAIQNYGDQLLELTQKALHSDHRVGMPEPLSGGQKRQLDRLRARVREKGEELGIDPALLASRKLLELLLRAHATGGELPQRLTGWRMPVITETLIACLNEEGPQEFGDREFGDSILISRGNSPER